MSAPAKFACLLLITLATALALPAKEGPNPVQTQTAAGWDHFYNLEYPAAAADFAAVCKLDADSAPAWNHLAEARLYQEMYRVGALEAELYGHGDPFLVQKNLPPDPQAVSGFLAAQGQARLLAQQELNRAPNSAQAHYDLAVADALHGTYEFTLARSYIAALGDARRARAEAARALALQPDLIDANLILGVHNYVAGSLSWSAKMLSAVVGYRGNREKGLEQIEFVAQHGGQARTDANVMLAVIDSRDGRNNQAAAILAELSRQYPRNVLFAVEYAEAAEAAGQHAEAQQQYHAVLERALQGQPGYANAPLDKVWYDLGKIEQLESHWPVALADFREVEALPTALPRYRQAAALAAGECDEQLGDTAAAEREYRACVSLDANTPAGIEALRRLHER